MTDTMSPRERFKHLANQYMDSEYHRDDEDIDEMLAFIRAALLSEPAVDAAMAVIEYRSQEPLAAQDWKEERDDWKEAVTAAFDAAFGDQQP